MFVVPLVSEVGLSSHQLCRGALFREDLCVFVGPADVATGAYPHVYHT